MFHMPQTRMGHGFVCNTRPCYTLRYTAGWPSRQNLYRSVQLKSIHTRMQKVVEHTYKDTEGRRTYLQRYRRAETGDVGSASGSEGLAGRDARNLASYTFCAPCTGLKPAHPLHLHGRLMKRNSRGRPTARLSRCTSYARRVGLLTYSRLFCGRM